MRGTVIALHRAEPAHLRYVVAEMQRRMMDCFEGGDSPRPRILGYEQDGSWQAICGSHRIAAAGELGVPLTLVPIPQDVPLTEPAIVAAAGELLDDLPVGLTPREIVAERDRLRSGVTYQCQIGG